MIRSEEVFKKNRYTMVQEQIIARGVKDDRVIQAMLKVPRHFFVPQENLDEAYEDFPISIGFGQTISQPYIVAYMLEKLELDPSDRVLEIGSGSGYVLAVLSRMVQQVYGVEVLQDLVERSQSTLMRLGYDNVTIELGDGRKGWTDQSPFDAILVSAASSELPVALSEQLSERGRLIYPQDSGSYQTLILCQKQHDGLSHQELLGVRFVPLIHR